MLSKLLAFSLVAAEVPDWGIYDDKTAEEYDHENDNMVWFSIKDYKKTSEKEISDKYMKTMTELKKQITTKFPDKKYHVVFFDSDTYADHAKEGLNCVDIETKSCISVIQAIKENENAENPPDEAVYTMPIEGELHAEGAEADAQRAEFFKFVDLVETGSEEDKKKHRHTPTFDFSDSDEDEEGDGPKDEEEFGDDAQDEV